MVGAEPESVQRYLTRIGMGEPLIERTLEVIVTIGRFLPDEPTYLFVSDYRDEEGNRSYESLWLTTDTVISEAHQFVTSTSFDLSPSCHGISRVLVETEEFDFDSASERSRMKVDVNFGNPGVGMVGELKASGSNCEDLQELLERYLLPLLSVSA